MLSNEKKPIPPGWQLIKLGDVIELKYGKSLIKSKRDGGVYPVYGSNGVVGFHSNFLVEKSCLIVGRKGTIGEVNFSESSCWPIDTTYYIDQLCEQPIKFWFYRLKALKLEKLDRASAIPGLNREDAYKLIFPLPPLNEQKRIVAKIEALQTKSDRVKEQLEEIKPLLDRFRQSVLAAAFRGDLTKNWREQNPDVEPAEVLLERIRVERRRRWEEAELEKMKAKGKTPKDDKWKKKYKEPELIDHENLPELPDGWCWVSVEQFADVGTGATPLRKNTKYYDGGTIPWVTSGALNEIFIETAEEYITPLAIKETNAKVFPKHTLLVAMYGEGKTRGKVSELLIEAATNQACAALVLDGLASKIRSIVKLFFLKNYSDIRRIASGGVQPNLNLGMIKSTLVPLPPLEEQIVICSLVEQCMLAADNIEREYQQAEIDLETLNQSILAKAFRGELVPQDPNDEPASVLLERIREEKAAAKKSSKKKKKTEQLKLNL